MLTIMNTTICTNPGRYNLTEINLDEARHMVAAGFESAVGHQSTAEILTALLGVTVPVNRIEYRQGAGDIALCFKLKGRPPEGKILSREEIEQIGYGFQVLHRVS